MRVLAACSVGGAGHWGPLRPVLAAARRAGDDVVVVAPAGLRAMVERDGHAFVAGAEPDAGQVAEIRALLPRVDAQRGSVLGSRELFGRLATEAFLPATRRAVERLHPEVVVREPCEYASAITAAEAGIPAVQVAISLADAEHGSIAAAAPALEQHRPGLVDTLLVAPYLTRLPASLDPSPFPATVRFRDRPGDRCRHGGPRWSTCRWSMSPSARSRPRWPTRRGCTARSSGLSPSWFNEPTPGELDGTEPVGPPPAGFRSWAEWMSHRWPSTVA